MRRLAPFVLALGAQLPGAACTAPRPDTVLPPVAPTALVPVQQAEPEESFVPDLLKWQTWERKGRDGKAFAGEPTVGLPKVEDLPAALRPSLRGDYWKLPVRLGSPADRDPYHSYIDTRTWPSGGGRLVSRPFPVEHRFVSFLVGAGGGDETRVELHVKLPGERVASPLFTERGPGVLGMRRVVWDTGVLLGAGPAPAEAQVVLVNEPGSAARPADAPPSGLPFLFLDDVRVQDAPPRRSSPPVFGFADLHVHLFNQLGFGGVLLHGCVWAPQGRHEQGPWCPLPAQACPPGEDCRMRTALPDCGVSHGKTIQGRSSAIDSNPGHATGGYPAFDGWPTVQDVGHQKMYIDWLRRAYDGGLRLIQLDVGNSHVLASAYMSNMDRHDPKLPLGDDAVIELQLDAAWRFVRGPAKDWAAIARSPAEARRIIESGKLAIVLGVETDTFGGFTSHERIQAKLREDPSAFRTQLQHLHDRGVRHMIPIHLTDNAFGGASVFGRKWQAVTKRVTGHGLQLQNGFLSSGVRYRLDEDDTLLDGILELYVGGRPPPMSPFATRSPLGLAHVNREGLSPWGRVLVEEMMKLGILVDVDHMSDAAVEETLSLAAAAEVPVMASHGGARALAFGALAPHTFERANRARLESEYHTDVTGRLASERLRSDDQIRKIAALGGIIGVGMDTGSYSPEVRQARVPLDGPKIAHDCDGSTVSFAETVHHTATLTGHRGVAFGTDVNGFAAMSGPRFGARACAMANADDCLRKGLMRQQANRQRDGVVYAFPTGKKRLGHFDDTTVYDEAETRVWAALAKAFLESPVSGPFDGSKAEGHPNGGCGSAAAVSNKQSVFCQILAMWNHAHTSAHEALTPSVTGDRVFDVNVDGVAHYGMVPDALQDLRNIGAPERDLQTLLYSAEDYIQMWERAVEGQAKARALFAPDAGCTGPKKGAAGAAAPACCAPPAPVK